MTSHVTAQDMLASVLTAGYVASIVAIVFVVFLVSFFYQKKINRSSPKSSFVVAILFGLSFILTTPMQERYPDIIRMCQIVCLSGSGIASIWGSVTLYLTMRRIPK